MKGMMSFLDLERFLANIDMTATACMPWIDYNTKQRLGTKVDVFISRDANVYKPRKDGSIFSNLGEKFTIKVPGDVHIDIGSLVTAVDPEGTIYGDYNDKLSVQAKAVKVITGKNS